MSDPSTSRPKQMTRGRFGAIAAGAAASFASARPNSSDKPSVLSERTLSHGATAMVALSGVPHGEQPEATVTAVRTAALAATDFSWLTRGDTVAIKPVCNSGEPYPATSDPQAVVAMIQLLREQGAGRILVADMSGVQYVRFWKDELVGSTRAQMHCAGLAAAIESADAELCALEEDGWDGFREERPTLGTSWKGPVVMPRILGEIDHVVLMPRCSRHPVAGSSLGLKAAAGWWRPDSLLEYHHDATSLAEKTVEANSVATLLEKQRLVVTSATRVLTTFGPDYGHVHEPDTGLIIAAPSVLAHDMVSLAWLLESRRATPFWKRTLADPHGSPIVADLANRLVTYWLGGLTKAMSAQWLRHQALDTIWNDLVLRHAFEIFGGVPRIELIDADGSVPPRLRERLGSAVCFPV